jgi:4'-phosphopantetheinyl transferase
MLRLAANDIDLWLTYFDEISDPDVLACYCSILTEEERRQKDRFYFPHDQRRYLVTRALVRLVLSRYAGIRPQDWRFSKNAFGRPAIANESDDVTHIDFNISHTRGLIVVAVVAGIQVGIDVENTALRRAPLQVADRYFSPDEVAALRALPQEQQGDRFFDYWTLKEAYIKARGLGLHVPLNLFSFHFPGARVVRMTTLDDLHDTPAGWRFWQFRPRPDYLMAVCGERTADEASNLTIREVLPCRFEKVMACAALRMSF